MSFVQTDGAGGNPASSDRAVLLLGHGSKAFEANETLRKVASVVRERAGYRSVTPAFLQIERPDFQEAVDRMVAEGHREITVMPYFLYMGLHVTKDLPGEIRAAMERHPGLEVTLTENLGFHQKLVDVTIERIEGLSRRRAAAPAAPAASDARPPATHPIEAESMRIISEELDATGFSPAELPVVKRVIHTTADFGFAELLRMSPGAVEAGVEAIGRGSAIVTDVNMVHAGITPARLSPFGARVLCFSSDEDVARAAARDGLTRSAAAMRRAAAEADGGIVAVGNAPTALAELVRLAREGRARPALVVGVPVGFVGAVEAKEALMDSGLPYIATAGRKGGSTVAVAIVNALAIEALNRASARSAGA